MNTKDILGEVSQMLMEEMALARQRAEKAAYRAVCGPGAGREVEGAEAREQAAVADAFSRFYHGPLTGLVKKAVRSGEYQDFQVGEGVLATVEDTDA